MLLSLLLFPLNLAFGGGGAPSMPPPPPPPVDPTTTPEAIAARQAAERTAEIEASYGLERNIVAGKKIAEEEQQKKGAARIKLGYNA